MKTLLFTYRGDSYLVNESGHIKANGLPYFSSEWVFRGGSRHHWSRHIDVSLAAAFANPSALNGCLGWDVDHGTKRQWRSSAHGSLCRIYGASVKG